MKSILCFIAAGLWMFYGISNAQSQTANTAAPTNLRIIDSFSQLGIDDPTPRFGWVVNDPDRSECETAYEIVVSSKPQGDGDCWKSGKVTSFRQYGIVYDGMPLFSCTQYWYKVRIWDKDGNCSPWSDETSFVTGFLQEKDWDAKTLWVIHGKPLTGFSTPMFRKEFIVQKKIKKAYAYVCGLGQFVFYLNGQKVGNHEIDPAWTDYSKSVCYVTFDVTDYLQQETNAIGVLLGNGWWEYYTEKAVGRHGLNDNPNLTGPAWGCQKMTLKMELHVIYEDDTRQKIVTDRSWKGSESPFTLAYVYGSEEYDACLEQPGWNRPGFDDSDWIYVGRGNVLAPLESQKSPPVITHVVLETQKITNPSPNVYVFDIGQNINGQHEIYVKGPRGAVIEIVAGEVLQKNGRVLPVSGHGKQLYTYSKYTLKGQGMEVWRLTLSTAGFQYIEIRNVTRDPNCKKLPYIDDVKGYHTYTAAREVGTLKTSDSKYNQVLDLTVNTYKNNLVSIHTDCPTREKLGWQENTHGIAMGAMYSFDLQTLWTKISKDIREAQFANGMVPTIVPKTELGIGNYGDAPSWGSATILNPWDIYWVYGDIKVLADNYDTMKRYAAYLKSRESNDQTLRFGLGDWNAPGGTHMPNIASAIYYYNIMAMRNTADVLSKAQDVECYNRELRRIKAAYNAAFFDNKAGCYKLSVQSTNAMPLWLGLVPEGSEQKVLKSLLDDITAKGGHLSTGDIACRFLFNSLSKYHRDDVVAKMIMNPTHPSYYAFVKDGYNTMLENFSRFSTSYSHDMFGHNVEWMYRTIGGISNISPGYKDIMIKPILIDGLTGAKTSYKSVRGQIKCDWSIDRKKKDFRLDIVVPVNTRANVYIPVKNKSSVRITESDRTLWQGNGAVEAEAVTFVNEEKGYLVWNVGSGCYQFTCSNNK